MLYSFLLILASLTFAAIGQYFLKIGANELGALGGSDAGRAFDVAWKAATNPWLVTGLTCYGLGAVTWIIVLTRVQLSWAYPMLALNQVLILLIGWGILKEPVNPLRWGGVLLIITGVVLVSRS
ncbi:MAG: EamA family transporter [Candidatus Sericytochromatia bacterium]